MITVLKEEIQSIKDEYSDISDLEAQIVHLRREKFSYTAIQRTLGNPSKKFIRNTLNKYDPESIELDCNYNKINIKRE